MRHLFRLVVVSIGAVIAATHLLAGDAPLASPPEKEKEEKNDESVVLSPFEVQAGPGVGYSAASTISGTRMNSSLSYAASPAVGAVPGSFLGATVGGFKDLNFGRHLLEWGLLPHASEITIEGLFSEFDLPTPDADAGGRLLTITGDAKAAAILNRPAVTHLAQIGFSSGLDARTWRRDPVFLVVVADVSGSMQENLPLLRMSIRTMLSQLGPDDAFALVSFSTDTQLDAAPQRVTPETAPALGATVDRLAIRGGTNIEAGLQLGFSVAQTQVAGFAGRTRVVLITDALPNIGATSAGSFMAQAEAASLAGTGLTTIGVGLDFSAEFVKEVSSVSGGNAFYFADAAQMEKKLRDDFDFMITELAFDIAIRVEPAPGFRLVDVYGLPGDGYVRTPEGGLMMDLKTLFLSRERGAIFLSFTGGPDVAEGAVVGRASLSYLLYGASGPERSAFDLVVRAEARAGVGLSRGELLINEYEALRGASTAFYEAGDLRSAQAQAEALVDLFAADADPALRQELALLEDVASFLDFAVETPELDRRALRHKPASSPLVGLWRFEAAEAPSRYLMLSPAGRAAIFAGPNAGAVSVFRWKGKRLFTDGAASVTLGIEDAKLVFRSADRRTGDVATWQLARCAATETWNLPTTANEVTRDDQLVDFGCTLSIAADEDDADRSYVAAETLVGTRQR